MYEESISQGKITCKQGHHKLLPVILFLPFAVFSIAKHLLFREHKAVIRKLARQRNDVGCFPEEKKSGWSH